jgi:hypothetical protein
VGDRLQRRGVVVVAPFYLAAVCVDCLELVVCGKDATDFTLELHREYPAVFGGFIDNQHETVTAFDGVVAGNRFVVVMVAACGQPLDHADVGSSRLGGSCLLLGGTLETGGLGLEWRVVLLAWGWVRTARSYRACFGAVTARAVGVEEVVGIGAGGGEGCVA